MSKNLSFESSFILLMIVLFPPVVYMTFETSSMAPGVFVFAVMLIVFFLVKNTFEFMLKVSLSMMCWVLASIFFILFFGEISWCINDAFDYFRFFGSGLLLVIFIVSAFFLFCCCKKFQL